MLARRSDAETLASFDLVSVLFLCVYCECLYGKTAISVHAGVTAFMDFGPALIDFYFSFFFVIR